MKKKNKGKPIEQKERINAVVYLRQSESKANEPTIEEQKNACLEFGMNRNLNVLEIFEDTDYNKDNLKGMLNFLEANENIKVENLIVYALSHILFDLNFAIYLGGVMNSRGIRINSVSDTQEISGEEIQVQCLKLLTKKLGGIN